MTIATMIAASKAKAKAEYITYLVALARNDDPTGEPIQSVDVYEAPDALAAIASGHRIFPGHRVVYCGPR